MRPGLLDDGIAGRQVPDWPSRLACIPTRLWHFAVRRSIAPAEGVECNEGVEVGIELVVECKVIPLSYVADRYQRIIDGCPLSGAPLLA